MKVSKSVTDLSLFSNLEKLKVSVCLLGLVLVFFFFSTSALATDNWSVSSQSSWSSYEAKSNVAVANGMIQKGGYDYFSTTEPQIDKWTNELGAVDRSTDEVLEFSAVKDSSVNTVYSSIPSIPSGSEFRLDYKIRIDSDDSYAQFYSLGLRDSGGGHCVVSFHEADSHAIKLDINSTDEEYYTGVSYSTGSTYYITLKQTSNDLILEVYGDSERTNLLGSASRGSQFNTGRDYQQIWGRDHGADSGATISGVIDNLELKTYSSGTWTSRVWDSGGIAPQEVGSFDVNASIGSNESVMVRLGVDEDDDGVIDTWSHSEGEGINLSDGLNSLSSSSFDLPNGYRYKVEFNLSVTDDNSHTPEVNSFDLKTEKSDNIDELRWDTTQEWKRGEYNNIWYPKRDLVTLGGSIYGENYEGTFENQKADLGVPEGWELGDVQQSYTFNVTNSRAYQGNQSMKFTTNADSPASVRPVEQPYSTKKTAPTSVFLNIGSGGATYTFYESGTLISQLLFEQGSNGLEINNYDGSRKLITDSVSNDEWIYLRLYNIDPSSNTYSLRWVSPSDSGKTTGLNFEKDMIDGYDAAEIKVGASVESNVYIDNYRIDPASKGQHTTENIGLSSTKSFNSLEATASIPYNTSVSAVVETSDDDFVTIEDSVSVQLLNGTNTYDISGLEPASEVRLRTEMNTSDLDSSPAVDSYRVDLQDYSSTNYDEWTTTEDWGRGTYSNLSITKNRIELDLFNESAMAAFYPMKAGSGGTLYDYAKGNDGVINGSTWKSDSHFGSYLNFDGTDDYVDLGAISFNSSFTVMGYLDVDKIDGNFNTFLSNQDTNNGIAIEKADSSRNDELRFAFKDGAGSGVSVRGKKPNINHIYHLAAVWDGSKIYFYQNSSLQGSASVSTHNEATKDLHIGNSIAFDNYFDGGIYTLRIYPTNLPQSQIQRIYEKTRPSSSPNSSHTTETVDLGSIKSFQSLEVNASVPTNTSINMTVEASDDSFSTVKDSITVRLENGRVSYDISSLSGAQYYRVRTDMSTSNLDLTPAVDDMRVKYREPTTPAETYRINTSSQWSKGTKGELVSIANDSVDLDLFNESAMAAFYPMKAGSGGMLYDYANGNDGVINGARWEYNQHFGNYLDFDGTDDYVSDIKLDFMDSITVLAWINTSQVSDSNYIVSNQDGATDNDKCYLRVDSNGNIKFGVHISGGSGTSTSTETVDDSKYHLVGGVYDYSKGKAYHTIDGDKFAGESWSNSVDFSSHPFKIGRYEGYPSYDFNGEIFSVRIYDKPLTATEIQEVYEKTRPSNDHVSFYTTQTIDLNSTRPLQSLKVSNDLSMDTGVSAELQVSDDNFSTVKDSKSVTLYSGSNWFDLSDVADARYFRINFSLATSNLDTVPSLDSLSLSVSKSNNLPTVSDPSPSGGTVLGSTDSILSVDLSDADGDSMDAWFFNANNNEQIGSKQTGIDGTGSASVSWTGLEANTTYNWYVNVSDGKGNYTSNTFTFEVGLGINLTFKDSSIVEDGFNVYTNSSGTWNKVHSFQSSKAGGTGQRNTNFIDKDLEEGEHACYRVAAFNEAGESEKSRKACVTP